MLPMGEVEGIICFDLWAWLCAVMTLGVQVRNGAACAGITIAENDLIV